MKELAASSSQRSVNALASSSLQFWWWPHAVSRSDLFLLVLPFLLRCSCRPDMVAWAWTTLWPFSSADQPLISQAFGA